MSTRCDSCEAKIDNADGHAAIQIYPPHPPPIDFTETVIIPQRRSGIEAVDVCAACILARLVPGLGLPTDIFVPNPKPIEVPPLAGALTPEEIAELERSGA